MNIFLIRSLRKCGALALLVAWLSACSAGSPYAHLKPNAKADVDDPDAVPVLITITPALLKSQKVQREHQVGQDIGSLIGNPKPYVIGAGDILSIVVWGHPELAAAVMTMQTPALTAPEIAAAAAPPAGFVVDHNGMLQFPYAGPLKMSGLTEEQARALLTVRLAHYINKPNITLRVQAYRSKRIYIDGEVKAPGLQAINDIPMTLVEALNRAGGVLPSADQSQIMINRGGITYQLNLPQLVQRGVDPGRIMLINGDIVRVRSRDESKVFVAGEVTTPKSLTMHNGRLTLNEALGESGGINPLSGDARHVYVVRKSSDKEPTVYQLNAGTPGALAIAESFELNPKDLVYVAPTALTNWHRSISLILPGALSSAFGASRQ